jgi:hypothetical protein
MIKSQFDPGESFIEPLSIIREAVNAALELCSV